MFFFTLSNFPCPALPPLLTCYIHGACVVCVIPSPIQLANPGAIQRRNPGPRGVGRWVSTVSRGLPALLDR